jgi:hypothetical protein
MTKSRGINRPRFTWTPILAELFAKLYPMTLTEDLAALLGCSVQQAYARAARQGIGKSEAFYDSVESGRTDGLRGAGSRFTKGHPSPTKGMKFPGRTSGYMFPPGHVPVNTMPIGAHRLYQGFVEVKLCDAPGPYTNRWKPVHRLCWERAHGPIPPGHVVAFKPGTKTTDPDRITPEILECITMAENMIRNQRRLGPEMAKVVQLRGAITRQINKRLKEQA